MFFRCKPGTGVVRHRFHVEPALRRRQRRGVFFDVRKTREDKFSYSCRCCGGDEVLDEDCIGSVEKAFRMGLEQHAGDVNDAIDPRANRNQCRRIAEIGANDFGFGAGWQCERQRLFVGEQTEMMARR